MKKPIKQGYLTERQAAVVLGKNRQFLSNDRFQNKKIPFLKEGRRVLYKAVDILMFRESLALKNASKASTAFSITKGTLSEELLKGDVRIVMLPSELAKLVDETTQKLDYFAERIANIEKKIHKSWLSRLFS